MDFDSFECLSFDCYGTLIDWERGLEEALRPALDARSLCIDSETLLEAFGRAEAQIQAGAYRPYRQVLREVLVHMGRQFGFAPSAEEREQFSASVQHWPAFADSAPALQALATRYRLLVLSNIDDDLFRSSQERLGVSFDGVFTAQQIGSYKPSRRNFQYLIAHAGAPPGRILHVAQSLFHDIAPARAMGLSTVWVDRRQGRSGSGATFPTEAAPDLRVPDLRTLAALAGVLA